MTDVALALLTGVLSSFVASMVWLVALRGVRPNISVSPQIAEQQEPKGYLIKLINRSGRAAIDLKFECVLITPKPMKNGVVKLRRNVAFLNEPPLFLPGRRRANDDDNAFRLRLGADIRQELEENEHTTLRFRIFVRDEVSGMGKVFEMNYNDPKSDIAVGGFSKGQQFEIY